MKGKIVCFRVLKHTDQKKTNEFCKKFYGQATSCHGYHYRRKGLLDSIPHRKLIRGAIIFSGRDVRKITKFLKSYNAEYYVRTVEVLKSDLKYLSR